MKPRLRGLFLVALAACSGPARRGGDPVLVMPAASRTMTDAQRLAAAPAVATLRAGHFDDAEHQAVAVLAAAPDNPQARLVRAVTRYQRAIQLLVHEAGEVSERADLVHSFDHPRMRARYLATVAELAAVDADLVVASSYRNLSLELCPGCWDEDWNLDGHVDDRDRTLLQIESDADGHDLPPGDPRRTPTFRFDLGDVWWARAMLAFQRGALELVLAYRWDELDKLFAVLHGQATPVVRFPLVDRDRFMHGRQLLMAALALSARARSEYLAETDDDREWVPSPRQHSHPIPLPVDAALYQSWADFLGDGRRLLAGQEGLDWEGALAVLFGLRMHPPGRFTIDVGGLLAAPGDIVLDFPALARSRRDDLAKLRLLFGRGLRSDLPPSALTARAFRVREDATRGDSSYSRKLRYLFWLN